MLVQSFERYEQVKDDTFPDNQPGVSHDIFGRPASAIFYLHSTIHTDHRVTHR